MGGDHIFAVAPTRHVSEEREVELDLSWPDDDSHDEESFVRSMVVEMPPSEEWMVRSTDLSADDAEINEFVCL